MNEFWTAVLGGVFRAILASAGGYAVAKGTISADQVTQIGGVVASVGAAGLSWYSKYRASRA